MLDYYDKEMNFIGVESRENVHAKGLWHKTVHCWLYDNIGNIYFQMRKDVGKLYTTASGHIQSGETIDDALKREIMEEVGLTIGTKDKELLAIDSWTMCSENCGVKKQDNVFANVYMLCVDNPKFYFDDVEVTGVACVKACEVLDLFLGKCDSVKGVLINNSESKSFVFGYGDFLLCRGEIAVLKYGRQLKFVCDKCVGK